MRTTLLLSVAALASRAAIAQTAPAFDPFPNGIASTYQFDLARNFFANDEALSRASQSVIDRARRLDSLRSRATDAAGVYAMLVAADTVALESGKIYAYLSLRPSIDTRDATANQEFGRVANLVEPAMTESRRVLSKLSEAQFNAFAQREPRLRRYAYAVARAREDAAHRLDSAAERALAADEGRASAWGPALFQRINASIVYTPIRAPEGELDFRRNQSQIWNHAERSVREAGYRMNQAGLGSRRDTFALIMTRTATERNATARRRNWPDYPSQTYAERLITPAQVRTLLNQLATHGELNKRYERARIAQIRRDFGYDSVHMWDLAAPPPGRAAPRLTIIEASREILAAAEPLGPGYVRELAALLDPANGRLDLVPRANRVQRPGFSTGSVGYPSVFFQGRFEGFVDDIVILGHEAGHAAQNMLMDSAGVLPRYANGPGYFTESFAVFSELVLLDHFYRTARTPAEKRYYLSKLLEDALGGFRNGYESLVELQVYDSASAGRQLSADGIEQLMQHTASRYSVWFGPGSERTLAWVQPLQFYTWPLYRVNYVYANLLALQYFDLLRRDPAGFRAKYNALLRNGYDATPDELLQRFLNVQLSDATALTAGAARVIEPWLREWEAGTARK
ncbi:MAG TPA: M3 family metallopeptidase [Gemmatimonadaceae bacterium]|nr:M3 family metallopeptidase [Gemmatimonadaceae bacterium]